MQPTSVVLAGLMATAMVSRADSQSVVPLKPLPAIQLEVTQSIPDLDARRFSLGFSQPTPIKDVLLLLVRDTRLSVVPDPSLDQRFIGDLKNVTLREALDLILEPLALDYSLRGQVIRVFPRELDTRFYSIDHVITQRTGRRSIGGSTEVTSTDTPDVYADLASGVRTLLSDEGRMNIDRTAALLQVTDRPSRLARVEQYLETAMLRVMRQIQIDAKVVEVELLDERSTGIDWKAALAGLARIETPAATPTNGFTVALTVNNFDALFRALSAQGTVNVLASPLMTAMNNEPAVMRVGAQTTSQAMTDGIALSVTSQISADGVIHMSVSARVTGQTVVRESDTVFRVRQGETIVMAGLTLPGATGRKTDVLILLTPTILQLRAGG